MTILEAAALAERLWSSPGTAFTSTVGIVRRGRKSPRFSVGMAYLDGTKAVTLGTSDVDWEGAFHNALEQENHTCAPDVGSPCVPCGITDDACRKESP